MINNTNDNDNKNNTHEQYEHRQARRNKVSQTLADPHNHWLNPTERYNISAYNFSTAYNHAIYVDILLAIS